MRFCPQCGAEVVAQAKFCVECGAPLAAGARPSRALRITPAFATVFLGIVAAGLIAAFLIMDQRKPAPQVAASEPSLSPADKKNLPAGHPKIELPPQARKFISDIEQQANQKPNDPAAWVRLGEVTQRASMLDDSYYAKAVAAYGHALKLDPDNFDALRGIGNLDYDRRKYDEAIAAYEHYLTKKPNDPEVRTDLGTMYLYTGNADQAVVQYRRAIADHPDFFEGYYNLGIAYGQENRDDDARAAFEKALTLAPDDKARGRTQQMLAKLGVTPAAPVGSASPAAQAAAAGTFEGDVEQLVRGLPIAGSRVKSVEWPSKRKAIVAMDNFPMDQMPPFAKQKFLNDLKGGLDSAKASYKVSGPVEVDITDAASGQVMETVSE